MNRLNGTRRYVPPYVIIIVIFIVIIIIIIMAGNGLTPSIVHHQVRPLHYYYYRYHYHYHYYEYGQWTDAIVPTN